MSESDFVVMLGQYLESGATLDQAVPAAANATGINPTIAQVRRAVAALETANDKAVHDKIDYRRLTR